MTETTQQHTKALVLEGVGLTGNAREMGVLLGLHDGGVDMSDAALVGTSAGLIVGAQTDAQKVSPSRPGGLSKNLSAESCVYGLSSCLQWVVHSSGVQHRFFPSLLMYVSDRYSQGAG